MKQVFVKKGGVLVDDVAAPQVTARNVLVQVEYSCISVGTEMAGVRMSGLPLYRRALSQPDNVRKVVQAMRDDGLQRTWNRVSGKLATGTATGYSAAGRVIAVGSEVDSFSPGDRVACAGAGVANHAEVIDVPVNLTVRVPEGLGTDMASTVTLGAIAMQGVRRAQPTLGETIVVIGLGILGQITAQLLKANGCRVIGIEIDEGRIAAAQAMGLEIGVNPAREHYVERVMKLTDGQGADGVIITAAAHGNDKIMSEALQSCRRKGRVVLVGDVGLNLNRSDLYPKELDFFISTSYGPGRYDPVYEEGGQDYPLAYVRWTENRNMDAYLRLLADGRVRLEGLMAEPYDVERAREAYEALEAENVERPLLVLLRYPQRSESRAAVVTHRAAPAKNGKVRVALVGAGGFAQGMHLPNMSQMSDRYELRAVMSRTGANARSVALQYGAAVSTTDYDQILNDPNIDLILIATRHNLHASMTLAGLRAGKNVFVEKPMAITEEELSEIEYFFSRGASHPMLMTGFNRRFSPAVASAAKVLAARTTPLMVSYRMNAGYLPPDHWAHGPEGGGRNIGEACHIYDLFNFLTNAAVTGVHAESIRTSGAQWHRNDNFVATISYADGSVCTLTYTALGAKSFPKERMDIFADGKVLTLDDYRSLTISGGKYRGWSSRKQDKGQFTELVRMADALQRGEAWPISLEQQLQATRISFEVERQIAPREALRGGQAAD